MKRRDFLARTATALLSGALPVAAPLPWAWAQGDAPITTTTTDGVRLIAPVGHRATINDFALSKDGKYAASCSDDNSAIVWEMATGRIVRRLTLTGNGLNVCFSSDGTHLLTTAFPSRLTSWNLADGKKQWAVTVPVVLSSLALRPDGQAVAVAGSTSGASSKPMTLVYRADTGAPLASFDTPLAAGKSVTHIQYARDGASLYGYNGKLIERLQNLGDKMTTLVAFDAKTGALLHTFENAGDLVAISRDGTRLLTRARGKAFWIDATSGKRLKTFSLEPQNDLGAQAITLRADDNRFATLFVDPDAGLSSNDVSFREYDARSGAVIAKSVMSGVDPLNYMLRYTPGGFAMTAMNRPDFHLTQFDIATGSAPDTMQGAAQRVYTPSALSPDGKTVYVTNGTRTGMLGWDITTRKVSSLSRNAPSTREGEPYFVRMPPALSDDGKVLATPSVWSDAVFVTDATNGKTLSTITVRLERTAKGIAVHPRGLWVAAPTRNGSKDAVNLYDAKTGAVLRELTLPAGPNGYSTPVSVASDSTGARVLVGDAAERLLVFDANTGALLKTYQPQKNHAPITAIRAIPGENDHVILTDYAGLAVEFDIADGAVVQTFTNRDNDGLLTPAVSVDGSQVALGRDDGVIELWSRTGTAKLAATMTGGSGRYQSLAFSPDGGRLTSLGGDGIVRFWNTELHRELSAVILFTRAPTTWAILSGDAARAALMADMPIWMAYDRAGFFEGDTVATQQITFAEGTRTFAAEQFYERYYKPGLLAESLSGGTTPPSPVPDASDAIKKGTPPLVRIVSPTSGTAGTATVEVAVEATEQAGGGIKAIRLYHNGRLVGGPAALRGITIEVVTGKTTTKKFVVPLVDGKNELRAVAYSNTDVESAPAQTTIAFQPPKIPRPVLHVLAVGINAYKDPSMNLAYARPDAEAIADFFGKTSPLFERVDVVRLVDEEATAEAIQKSLAEMATRAKPEDVLFIYLAGHGETTDGQWYFLPTEMRQMALEERVKQYGVPGNKLESAIAKIPAQKVVLVYDACKSGAALGGLRGNDTEQQALAVMARAQGIHILTASTAQQYAGEVKELGHGILTYALLEGLQGKAARATDASVLVRELMGYVEERVPALAKQYRGIEQYPIPFERGQNFPLVRSK